MKHQKPLINCLAKPFLPGSKKFLSFIGQCGPLSGSGFRWWLGWFEDRCQCHLNGTSKETRSIFQRTSKENSKFQVSKQHHSLQDRARHKAVGPGNGNWDAKDYKGSAGTSWHHDGRPWSQQPEWECELITNARCPVYHRLCQIKASPRHVLGWNLRPHSHVSL